MEHASSLGVLPGSAAATLQRRESIECRLHRDLNDSIHLRVTFLYCELRAKKNNFY